LYLWIFNKKKVVSPSCLKVQNAFKNIMFSSFVYAFFAMRFIQNMVHAFAFSHKFMFCEYIKYNLYSDAPYSGKLLTAAKSLYAFAKAHPGIYSNSVPQAKNFYG
jgi:hypothetical protein